jgi:hypothetical protein
MWENDGLVVTISRAKDQLNQQRNYIKNCIFLTLPEAEQEKMKEAEEIYSCIKNGQPYKTSAGKIIQAREDEKTRFKKEVHNHNVKLNNRYNSLVLDFENYLRNKNDQKTLTNNFSYDPLPPIVDAQQLRDILERDAKSNIPDGHFKGMAEGVKRKFLAV